MKQWRIQLRDSLYHPFSGGNPVYLFHVARELTRLGHQSQVLCSGSNGLKLGISHQAGVEIKRHAGVRTPGKSLGFLWQIPHKQKKLQQIFEQESGWDAIWCKEPIYAAASTRASNSSPVIFIQATVFPTFMRRSMTLTLGNRLRLALRTHQMRVQESEAVNNAQAVVALSESRKFEICQAYQLHDNRVTVIPPGVDSKRFAPGSRNQQLAKEFGIDLNDRVVLTVARLSREKNIPFIFETLIQMSKDGLKWIIVGEGPERLRLEQMIKDKNLQANVRIVGSKLGVEMIYRLADVFVLPSTYEGFGLVFLEAMACGLPCIGLHPNPPEIIVATDEIIQHGKTGFLVEAKPELLAQRLDDLLQDEAQRQAMGQTARELVQEKYTWQKTTEALLQLTEKVAAS